HEEAGVQVLDRVHGAGVQLATAFSKQTAIGHLVGERMLERVLVIGEQPRLVEELSVLQVGELSAQLRFGLVGDGRQKRKGHVLADDSGGLEQPLVLGGESVDPSREDRLDRGRYLYVGRRSDQPVRAGPAQQYPRLDERSDALFQEERVALRPLDQYGL